MEKVLIVEDDDGVCDFVKLELEHEGYTTCLAKTGRMALEIFAAEKPDIILLDIMLPELSGLEVLRRIRKESTIPVILLTARGETYDKVNGLNAGADDYIAKPFNIEELLARMSAVLRRSTNSLLPAVSAIKIRALELFPESMRATLDGNPVDFSKTEFLMLKNFMEHKDQVLSRDNIITAVWGENHFIDENNVDVYVGYLRSKIDQVAKEEYIKTVRGAGYMMVSENKK